MFGTRYDVFLSYSRADTARVQPLRDALRSLGYRVFFDVQSIDPGERWKTRLERSIRSSRTLVLCWSQNARASEYITFEYSRAEALHKPILPWLLDKTPLPAMLEVQGISVADPAAAAAALRPALGLTLDRRRWIQIAAAVVIAAALAVGLWFVFKPPPPWEFQGYVMDMNSKVAIAGVEVDVLSDSGVQASTSTDSKGHFDLHLPQPKPTSIHVRFRKDGYEAEEPLNYRTDKQSWGIYMEKLHE